MVVLAMLTAKLHYCEKGQISTLYKIETPEWIKIKFGTMIMSAKNAPKPNLVSVLFIFCKQLVMDVYYKSYT